jgi:predicted PurR-regulated permease PerM
MEAMPAQTTTETLPGSSTKTGTQRETQTEAAPSRRSRRSDIVFTFALAAVVYLAWMTREVLIILYVSALFAVVLMPVLHGIERLKIGRWHPSRGISILILFLGAILFFTLFFYFAVPPIVRDMREFLKELPTRGPQLLQKAQRLPILQHIDTTSLNAKLQDFASNSASYVFAALQAGAGTLADLATGIILTVYFVLEGEVAYNWLLSFFPVEPRNRLDKTLTVAEARMGKWLLGQGSLMLILGVTSTIVFLIFKVRYAYALGVIMGLFNIIPIAGALISMVLVILVAAIDSWGRVLGVCIFYAIYAQVETSFLTPAIMKSSVDLSGLAVVVALLIGSATTGVLGAMVSVPTAVLVAVLLNEYLVKSGEAVTPSGTPVQANVLKK